MPEPKHEIAAPERSGASRAIARRIDSMRLSIGESVSKKGTV
jgi:hypothetical protein